MRAERRLACSHGILWFQGSLETLYGLLNGLRCDVGYWGYSEGFDSKAAAILREIARVAEAEAVALDEHRAGPKTAFPSP